MIKASSSNIPALPDSSREHDVDATPNGDLSRYEVLIRLEVEPEPVNASETLLGIN